MTRLLLLVLICVALLPSAFAQDLDDDVVQSLMSRDDAAKLHKLLAMQPPSGLSGDDLDAFYRKQRRAALSLGDREQAMAVSRRRAAAFPDWPGVRWALWVDLAATDQLEESNRMGEELVFSDPEFARHRPFHARGLVFLAMGYLDMGRTGAAEPLIQSAEEELGAMSARGQKRRQQLSDKQVKHRTQTTALLHVARCRLFALRARNDDALQECRLAVQISDQVVDDGLRTEGGAQRNNTDQSVQVRLQLARLLVHMGRSYDAERTLKEALEMARKQRVQGPCLLSQGYGVLAKIRLGQRRGDQAVRQAGEAARLAASCDGGTLGHDTREATEVLLEAMVSQSSWREALATLDATDHLAADRPQLQGRVVYPLARALTYAHNGRADAALPIITARLQALRGTVGPLNTATALAQGVRGIVLASMTDPERRAEARNELAAAVKTLTSPDAPGHELLEQGAQATVSRLIFERYLESLGVQPGTSETSVAFGVADLMRTSNVQRALNDAAARSSARTSGLSELVRRDQSARNELDTLYAYVARHASDIEADRREAVSAPVRSRIAELERTRSELRAEIARGFPEYGRLVTPAPPSPTDVARQLETAEVLVSILPTVEHVHIWAVTRDGAVVYRRADLDAERVALLARRLRATLDVADRGDSVPSFDAPAAAELYRFLVQPLAPALEGKTHVIVAAGGPLAQVPFAVLPTAPAKDHQPMPWLIRQAAVSQVPGAAAWLAAKRLAVVERAREPLAAWGDPQFGAIDPAGPSAVSRRLQLPRVQPASGGDPEAELARAAIRYAQIPPLPETRDELLAIAATLHADAKQDVLLGERATRASVLEMNSSGTLANKRVLAFATHGLIAGDLPGLDEPALALAAVTGESSDPLRALLTLDDVLELKLNADWVVLSACNTAAADGQAQEALSGLARGFFYAGTRSLLVTHWAVETESARLLTTGTFEYYANHPSASKAESLRQAMLAVMAMPRYAHPAFWAPYALAGDGGR